MSSTATIRRSYIAVPHEPAAGPIVAPSIAALYCAGSDGAAPTRTCTPSVSSSRIVHDAPSPSKVSARRQTSTNSSGSGVLRVISLSTLCSDASTSAASPML